ncbi:MAG: hypothetical protein FJX46_15610 [Alphaproteobacteria bacterium]|nr:hypothetical protein [Alphaproteobacteria bacterium]
MRAILLLAAWLVSAAALAQGERVVAIAQPETQVPEYPIPSSAAGQAADLLGRMVAGTPGLKLLDRGAMARIQAQIKEIVTNPLYDQKAIPDLGKIVPAGFLLATALTGVEVEGEFEENGAILDIEKGTVIAKLAVRLIAVETGQVLSGQAVEGQAPIKSVIYDRRRRKTRDSEGPGFEQVLGRAMLAALAKVDRTMLASLPGGGAPSGTVGRGPAASGSLASTIIETRGEGTTCQAARQAALKRAVEQVGQTYVSSKTQVRDMQFDYGRIVSAVEGLVKGVKELSSEQIAGGGCRVTAAVEVVEGKLHETLDAFVKDRLAMATFVKQDFANRSVAVLYSTRGMPEALARDSKPAEAAVDNVQKRLAELGFDVKLAAQLKADQTLKGGANDDDAAIGLAKAAQADAVVLLTLSAGRRRIDQGVQVVLASLLMKAYEPGTRRLFGTVDAKGQTVAAEGDFALAEGAARAAVDAAKDGVPELLKQVVAHFQSRGNTLLLAIDNAPAKVMEQVEDLLAANGIDYAVERQAEGQLVLKVQTAEDAAAFRARVRRLAQAAGIDIRASGMDGGRITFSGQGR